MSTIDLLLEKYLKTINVPRTEYRSGDYEVFINPSRRDIRDVSEFGEGHGYRFLIDFKNKKTYVISAETFHQVLMDDLPELPNFKKFWDLKKHTDYIFTGDVSGGYVSSDALYGEVYEIYQIQKMLDMDWSFVPKSLPIKEIRNMMEEYE